MMKKISKILLICLPIFLLCGCTTKYDLTINSDYTMTEKISGNVSLKELDNSDRTDLNTYLYALELATPLIEEQGEYQKEITENKDSKDFVYTYTFKNNYSKSTVLNKCFENIEYSETDETYKFHFYGNFYCLLSDKIEVNLISKYWVMTNNADKIDKNTYTWIIKQDKNVDIEATINKNIEAPITNNESSIFTPYRIITFIVFIILVLALFIIYRKRNSEK